MSELTAAPVEPTAEARTAEPEAPIESRTAELETSTVAAPLVEQELLVEDVSIDGMCGVY